MEITQQTCRECGKERKLSDFREQRKGSKRYRRVVCKECERQYNRSYEEKNRESRNQKCRDFNRGYYLGNKERYWRNNLRLKYNITPEDLLVLKESQGYSCKLCGTHEDNLDKPLFVDHCHDTGEIRGLLCRSCNSGLGMLGDNVAGLERAISYLKGELN